MKSISNSSLGKNINRAMEMKNYLYLTWLEIWAYTFGNNDFGEKHYRFDQMLDVLDKVIHHEMNILNLMFDILKNYPEVICISGHSHYSLKNPKSIWQGDFTAINTQSISDLGLDRKYINADDVHFNSAKNNSFSWAYGTGFQQNGHCNKKTDQ